MSVRHYIVFSIALALAAYLFAPTVLEWMASSAEPSRELRVAIPWYELSCAAGEWVGVDVDDEGNAFVFCSKPQN
jgi:hypothetical protein